MKRLSAVFALTALGAATVGLAQQPYSHPPQQTPPSTSQKEQTSPSKAEQQALIKDCLTKMQAASPNASKEDFKAYCDQKVKERSSAPK
jgi:hypothetical protein